MASLREYDDAGVADNYANDYRVIHPDGRIASDSAAASPAAGERLIAASAASVVTSYQAFLAEA